MFQIVIEIKELGIVIGIINLTPQELGINLHLYTLHLKMSLLSILLNQQNTFK